MNSTNITGNSPRRDGSFSIIPSIQSSSFVTSFSIKITSPTVKDNSSAWSASQSYKAMHLRNLDELNVGSCGFCKC